MWDKKDKNRTRPVSPGRYKIKNYTIVKEHEGDTWILSGSGGRGQIVNVEKGRTTAVKIDERINLKANAKRQRGAIKMGTCFIGDKQMGLSIFKGEDRIDFRYALMDKNGRVVEKGEMKYG